MVTPTDNPINRVPRYWGEPLDDALANATKAAAGGNDLVAGLGTAAIGQMNDDTKKNIGGWWEKILDCLNIVIHFLLKLAFPDSTTAEDGLDAKIDNLTVFDTLEKKLGLDGLGNYLRDETAKGVRNFNGLGMMPKGDAIDAAAKKAAATIHGEIVTKITDRLLTTYPGRFTDEQAATIAQNAAAMASGLDPDDVLSPNADARISASTPTNGLVAALIKTATAAKADGSPRGSFKAADVDEIAIDKSRMTAITQAFGSAAPAPDATDEAMRSSITQWLEQAHKNNIKLDPKDDSLEKIEADMHKQHLTKFDDAARKTLGMVKG